MKICGKCKIEKELIEFNKHKRSLFGVCARCKLCLKKAREEKFFNLTEEQKIQRRKHEREVHKIYYYKNKEKSERASRNSKYKRDFGITIEKYDEMLLNQNNVCYLCFKPETMFDSQWKKVKRLAVDHDHKTGKVRGLLCAHCNHVLGKVNDSVELLQRMIDYLNLNKA